VRKTLIIKIKWFVAYGRLFVCLANAASPTQAIGLPIFPLPSSPPIIRCINSGINSDNYKKRIIAQVIKNNPETIDLFSEQKIEDVYNLAVKYVNKSISKEQLLLEL